MRQTKKSCKIKTKSGIEGNDVKIEEDINDSKNINIIVV